MKCSCCGKELTLKERVAYYKQRSKELEERSEIIIEQARKEINDKVDKAIDQMTRLLDNI